MPITSTTDQPVDYISREDALDHWRTGGGSTVYIDMETHLTSGAGQVFRASPDYSPARAIRLTAVA